MPRKVIVRRNEYHDSIQLMSVSQELRGMEGVNQAMVAMATGSNLKVMADLGLVDAAPDATPDDMLVAVDAVSEIVAEAAAARLEELFQAREAERAGRRTHRTFESALRAMPDANLCVITVPGEYACAEARKALVAGLHVCIYSDNVPLDEERELKKFAAERGLLCMGPDCGSANINGAALLTASVVARGPIGVAGASGSGTQQVTVLVEREGLGVSQAIGLGGKDLKDEVGGTEMLFALDALEEDPETKVIVLISRAPGENTLARVLGRVRACTKPVVVYFIGGDRAAVEKAGGITANDLEDAALKAVALVRGSEFVSQDFSMPTPEARALAVREAAAMAPGQRHLRGLFCGGTFCEEAMAIAEAVLGGIQSNAPLRPELKLADSFRPKGHAIVDLGDEEFTLGRPHPAIDPEPICRAIRRESEDPSVAVLLIDFILSHALNPDPVGSVLAPLREARQEAAKRGGHLAVVASVCGTEGDPQVLSAQEAKLREIGVVVMPSNAQAARMAAMIAAAAAARQNTEER